MKQRPLLYKASMVNATIDGHKTQTRRIVKLPQKARWGTDYDGQVIFDDGSTFGCEMTVDEMRCPYGAVADHLWVRETTIEEFMGSTSFTKYVADGHIIYGEWSYSKTTRPSIFMPRELSRILLEITGVRVERLHEITEEDALAEGITKTDLGFSYCENSYYTSAKEAYESLWKSINGVKSWVDNPWVWVITFKVVEIKR